MATMTEDYVSFETAKLLKEKGFDQNCATYYLDGQVWRHYHGEVIPKYKQIYAAPNQAMAMKWLREVHKLFIEIKMSKNTFFWGYRVSISNGSTVCLHANTFNECEEACEVAIKHCLENLI